MQDDPTGTRVEGADPRRWRALTLLALVQFIIFLDVTIVNVALPSIQRDLGFTAGGLTWVVNGYLLAAGGLLLLGGRLADILGRRRIFACGAGLFVVSSLTAALAESQVVLIVARFLQGIAEALAAPAAMSMVALLFTDPAERNKAFGIWGGLAGLGSAAGVLLSGVLTDLLSWRLVFFVNVPLALIPMILIFRAADESKMDGARRPSWVSAVLITAGMVSVIQGVLNLTSQPFASAGVLVPLVAGVVLLAAFAVVQTRSDNPLLPLSFLRNRVRLSGNLCLMFLNSTTAAMFFVLVLYMQDTLGYSPLVSGLAWLPYCVGFGAGLQIAMTVMPKAGPGRVLPLGLLIAGVGILLLTFVPVDGSYWLHVLPGTLLISIGGGMSFPCIQTVALSGLGQQDAGLGSGVMTTVGQLGQALGLATIVAVALGHTTSLGAAGVPAADAAVSGYRLAFLIAGALLVAGALFAAVQLRRGAGPDSGSGSDDVPDAVSDSEPADDIADRSEVPRAESTV